MNITPDQLDELGRLADMANNLAAASQLPVAPAIHITCMRQGLIDIDKALKKMCVEISGDDPWEDMP